MGVLLSTSLSPALRSLTEVETQGRVTEATPTKGWKVREIRPFTSADTTHRKMLAPTSGASISPTPPGWPPLQIPRQKPLVPLRIKPKKKICPIECDATLRVVCVCHLHRSNLDLQSAWPCLCGTNLRGLTLASQFSQSSYSGSSQGLEDL